MRCWTYNTTAEEEVSRCKGHTTVAEMTATTSQAGVTPPAHPASPSLSSPPLQEPLPPLQEHSLPLQEPPLLPQELPLLPQEPSLSPMPGLQQTPPQSQTTELNDGATQTLGEQDSLQDVSSCSKRSPAPPGAFAYCGSSPFITPATIQYLETVCAGQRWTDMVNSFLRLEELPVTNHVSTLLFILFHSYSLYFSPVFIFPLNLDHVRCLGGSNT